MNKGNVLIAVGVLTFFFGLHAFVYQQDQKTMETSLSSNISAAIMQCLPEEVDEVCTIKLVQENQRLKLITERHSAKQYGQPVKPPSVKFVVALKD